jgi:hypothetical protein
MRHTILITALSFLVAAPAAAQQLKVSFDNGLVSVDANAVPVRQILNEWAKQGGTKVVGVERITGAPLTIKLIDVPESRALEVILRSVAGYMAAPRASGTGASMYDRILVMATSAAPAAAAAAASPAARPTPPNQGMNGTQRFVPPRQQQAEDEDREEEDPNPPNPPVFTFPQQQQPGMVQPGQFPTMPVNGQPMIVNPAAGGQNITINPAQPGGYPTTMPIGSPTPGMINAPPPQPGQPVRPPGRQQQRQ